MTPKFGIEPGSPSPEPNGKPTGPQLLRDITNANTLSCFRWSSIVEQLLFSSYTNHTMA